MHIVRLLYDMSAERSWFCCCCSDVDTDKREKTPSNVIVTHEPFESVDKGVDIVVTNQPRVSLNGYRANDDNELGLTKIGSLPTNPELSASNNSTSVPVTEIRNAERSDPACIPVQPPIPAPRTATQPVIGPSLENFVPRNVAKVDSGPSTISVHHQEGGIFLNGREIDLQNADENDLQQIALGLQSGRLGMEAGMLGFQQGMLALNKGLKETTYGSSSHNNRQMNNLGFQGQMETNGSVVLNGREINLEGADENDRQTIALGLESGRLGMAAGMLGFQQGMLALNQGLNGSANGGLQRGISAPNHGPNSPSGSAQTDLQTYDMTMKAGLLSLQAAMLELQSGHMNGSVVIDGREVNLKEMDEKDRQIITMGLQSGLSGLQSGMSAMRREQMSIQDVTDGISMEALDKEMCGTRQTTTKPPELEGILENLTTQLEKQEGRRYFKGQKRQNEKPLGKLNGIDDPNNMEPQTIPQKRQMFVEEVLEKLSKSGAGRETLNEFRRLGGNWAIKNNKILPTETYSQDKISSSAAATDALHPKFNATNLQPICKAEKDRQTITMGLKAGLSGLQSGMSAMPRQQMSIQDVTDGISMEALDEEMCGTRQTTTTKPPELEGILENLTTQLEKQEGRRYLKGQKRENEKPLGKLNSIDDPNNMETQTVLQRRKMCFEEVLEKLSKSGAGPETLNEFRRLGGNWVTKNNRILPTETYSQNKMSSSAAATDALHPKFNATNLQPVCKANAISYQDPSNYESLDNFEEKAFRDERYIISFDECSAMRNFYYFHLAKPKRKVRKSLSPAELLKIASLDCYTLSEQASLRIHNYYRAKHNVPPLVASEHLTEVARDWAEQLALKNAFYHRPNNKFGENLYRGDIVCTHALAAIKAWYDEIDLYDYDNPGFSKETGHFTQLIWKDTREVGTAIAVVGKSVWVVCNYHPPGNVIGRFNDVYAPRPIYY